MTSKRVQSQSARLVIPAAIQNAYPDVLTREALDSLEALSGFNAERRRAHARPQRQADRTISR